MQALITRSRSRTSPYQNRQDRCFPANMAEGTNADAVFDPHSVDLDAAALRDVVCYMTASTKDFDGRIGARVSAIFVLLATSTFMTVFPVLATRVPRLRIPRYVYLFARYFGAGVIVATAFIHLLDPAYDKIGPASCVGLTAGWSDYSWPPAIAMTSVMLIFLLDFGAEWYVEQKYGFAHADVEGAVTTSPPPTPTLSAHTKETSSDDEGKTSPEPKATQKRERDNSPRGRSQTTCSHQFLHSGEQDEQPTLERVTTLPPDGMPGAQKTSTVNIESIWGEMAESERAFRQQIVAFMILEFGVIFHSVIIGLNLGVVGREFSTLYPVIVFHQAFEGLGIGARLSMIPFPKRYNWLPWALCAAYGLTTPIAVAIGLGMATTYDSGSFVASVVSGVLDSISAGILLYTGLVELLARDFLFNPDRSRKKGDIIFMLVCLFLGTIIMALLGRWA
ncbi:zinc-regulated transporter 1 [Immersiella caudata]|uniref:Zinc-regulated transporter 1 n=1 Tax=Immersiella caudata TaxID=314043 RepID=A0AA39WSB4_9PEZI|nr:zinc-regulated transporter 1 [Immersiella caudata]